MRQGSPFVVVQGGRIVDVDLSGTRPCVALPLVDLDDVTLLPGVVEARVHLAFDPRGDVVEHMSGRPGTLLARMHACLTGVAGRPGARQNR
jgi:imidazolonepropionase-like amidohydrolase